MSVTKKSIILLVVAAILVAASWVLFWPPAKKITMGLDIQGGLSVILTANPSGNEQVTADVMDRVETVVRNRVDGLGVKEASVQRQGETSLLVQIPGADDPQAALAVLEQTGRLEFVSVASITDTAAAAAIASGEDNVQLTEGTYQPISVDGTELTGEVITDASVNRSNSGEIVVNLNMNSAGAKAWSSFTASSIGQQVAIVLDGTVKSAPVIESAIPAGQTQISGTFTNQEAASLRTILLSGSLPVSLEQSQASIVEATLGADSLHRGVLAAIVGMLIVAAYVILYYRGLGVITALALITFASLFLGVLATMSMAGVFALTLPGIAGIVLTIGLAADSSILINERFKEEVRDGKSIRAAADSGTLHGIKTSVDADIVSFVSALVLYLVAIGPVRGFALTLMIGIACDIAMMLLFKRPLVILLAPYMEKVRPLFGLKTPDDIARRASVKGGAENA